MGFSGPDPNLILAMRVLRHSCGVSFGLFHEYHVLQQPEHNHDRAHARLQKSPRPWLSAGPPECRHTFYPGCMHSCDLSEAPVARSCQKVSAGVKKS